MKFSKESIFQEEYVNKFFNFSQLQACRLESFFILPFH